MRRARGTRWKFPPLQRAQIVELACLEPIATGLHISHWTSQDLARQAMAEGHPMGFTGVDDPYEPPIDPEITLKGYGATPEENARIVLEYLEAQGFLNRI